MIPKVYSTLKINKAKDSVEESVEVKRVNEHRKIRKEHFNKTPMRMNNFV